MKKLYELCDYITELSKQSFDGWDRMKREGFMYALIIILTKIHDIQKRELSNEK